MDSPPPTAGFNAEFRWPTAARFGLRDGGAGEVRAIEARFRDRWGAHELSVMARKQRRIVAADAEIVGLTAVGTGSLQIDSQSRYEHWEMGDLGERIEPDEQGDWAVKTGLWLDPRLLRRYGRSDHRRLIRLASPVCAALFAHRWGLRGYVAAISLVGFNAFVPALTPAAYVQQVEGGSIDAPVLRSHLCYGADVVAIVDRRPRPLAVVQWRP